MRILLALLLICSISFGDVATVTSPQSIEELEIGGGDDDADGGITMDGQGNVDISGNVSIQGVTIGPPNTGDTVGDIAVWDGDKWDAFLSFRLDLDLSSYTILEIGADTAYSGLIKLYSGDGTSNASIQFFNNFVGDTYTDYWNITTGTYLEDPYGELTLKYGSLALMAGGGSEDLGPIWSINPETGRTYYFKENVFKDNTYIESSKLLGWLDTSDGSVLSDILWNSNELKLRLYDASTEALQITAELESDGFNISTGNYQIGGVQIALANLSDGGDALLAGDIDTSAELAAILTDEVGDSSGEFVRVTAYPLEAADLHANVLFSNELDTVAEWDALFSTIGTPSSAYFFRGDNRWINELANFTLNNGAADGGNLTFNSLGFSDWSMDNSSGTLRFISGSGTKFSIQQAGSAIFAGVIYAGSGVNQLTDSAGLIDGGKIQNNTVTSTQLADTITGTRITPRIGTTASSATPTPTGDSSDQYNITALAADATFAAPSGTPTDGQRLTIRIKDNGTARALSWNAIYRGVIDTLPTTTTISKTMYLLFIYNSADTKWDLVAIVEEP